MRSALILIALLGPGCSKGDSVSELPPPTNAIATPALDAPPKSTTTTPSVLDSGVVGDAGATGTIRFLAVGDTGRGDANQKRVRDAMVGKCARDGCDFVLLLGDNFYVSGVDSVTDTQWKTKFETMYAGVHAPFYAALGNHDYGGGGNGNEFIKGQYQVDYTAVSAKWKMPAPYYTLNAGAAQFFAVDSNMQMYARDADQRTQVAAWLAASTSRWKIAFGHHPYKSNGPHGNAGTYDGQPGTKIFNGVGVKSFYENVICGKVDIMFSGHDHLREWMTDTCQGTELIVSGAGSEVTSLVGRNATRFQSARQGFAYVVLTPASLSLEFVNDAGNVDFSRVIQKSL